MAGIAENSETKTEGSELDELYNDFLQTFADHLTGKDLEKLRFLLSDHLKGLQVDKVVDGKTWLDQLSKTASKKHQGQLVISPTRINLLWEIAYVTKLFYALQCVYNYMIQTRQKELEGEGIMGYRKIMYDGLMESNSEDLSRVIAFYTMGSTYDLDSIWKAVFRVEEKQKLITRKHFDRFGKLLNGTAYGIFKDGLNRLNSQSEECLRKLTLPMSEEEKEARSAIRDELSKLKEKQEKDREISRGLRKNDDTQQTK